MCREYGLGSFDTRFATPKQTAIKYMFLYGVITFHACVCFFIIFFQGFRNHRGGCESIFACMKMVIDNTFIVALEVCCSHPRLQGMSSCCPKHLPERFHPRIPVGQIRGGVLWLWTGHLWPHVSRIQWNAMRQCLFYLNVFHAASNVLFEFLSGLWKTSACLHIRGPGYHFGGKSKFPNRSRRAQGASLSAKVV